MIGIDQEPERETLDKLNESLGDGKYLIAYEQTEGGVRVIVRTREQPPREISSVFSVGITKDATRALWGELTDRVAKTFAHEKQQAQPAVPVGEANEAQRDPPHPSQTAAESRADVDESLKVKPTQLVGPAGELDRARKLVESDDVQPYVSDAEQARSLGEAVVPADVAAEPGNPGEYGTRDYEKQADGTYKRRDDGGKGGRK